VEVADADWVHSGPAPERVSGPGPERRGDEDDGYPYARPRPQENEQGGVKTADQKR